MVLQNTHASTTVWQLLTKVENKQVNVIGGEGLTLSYSQFVAIGAALMLLPMMYTGKIRGIPVWKITLCCVWFTLGGVLSVKLMYFIESGKWSGRSFFGALFIAPPFAYIIAKLIKLPFEPVSDMCPAAISAILALLKFKCYQDGCCFGKVLYVNDMGQAVRFPSQLVELGTAFILMIAFLIIARSGWMKGCLYGLYMLLYGAIRFYLNTLRETKPFLLGMAAGNIWALLSVIIGMIWITMWMMKRRRSITDISQ